MAENTKNKLRIKLEELVPRDKNTTDPELEQILKRITGQEGDPCRANCDCGIGLICHEGVCTSDW